MNSFESIHHYFLKEKMELDLCDSCGVWLLFCLSYTRKESIFTFTIRTSLVFLELMKAHLYIYQLDHLKSTEEVLLYYYDSKGWVY